MTIAIVIVVVLAALLVIAGGIYFLVRVMKNKETADLNKYVQSDNSSWERMGSPGSEGDVAGSFYFINHVPEAQGIEMRVYDYAEPTDGSPGDDEGVCLSIIDRANRNGMILNGFALHLDAMKFGDTLWNDQFSGDAVIMERVITEKRAAWDQVQQEIIIGHYALFM